MIVYLLWYTKFIDIFDTLFLIITLFLLALLLVCLCLFFHSLPILTNILKFRPPTIYFDSLSFIKFNKDLQPLVYFYLVYFIPPSPPLFISHLRAHSRQTLQWKQKENSTVDFFLVFWKLQRIFKSTSEKLPASSIYCSLCILLGSVK